MGFKPNKIIMKINKLSFHLIKLISLAREWVLINSMTGEIKMMEVLISFMEDMEQKILRSKIFRLNLII